MQARFKKNTDFGQSQWYIKNLSFQWGRVRNDPQKGGDNKSFIQ